jgi:DNA-binding HxlR family transcriptional regulator
MTTVTPERQAGAEPHDSCLARHILDRIGDKWSAYVIAELGEGTRRFSQLRRAITGISQRMLTITLRALDRDGLVIRRVYPVIPPRVEYSLSPLGQSLLAVVEAVVAWRGDHVGDVAQARHDYDTTVMRSATARRN